MLEKLKLLGTKDLQNLAKSLTELKKQTARSGPQTDDELHAWILKNLKMDIPREAVCDDHQAPFSFIADLYFERVTSAVAMANRGGSKTASSAVLHLINSLFKPGCESLTVGAIEAQSKRAYESLKKFLVTQGGEGVYEPKDHPEIVRTIESETRFKNGSLVEIVPGTISAVSGPHNQKVHADEQDQMPPDVWQQSRHISQSKTIINEDGSETVIKAQDWVTSTRQRPFGPMQKLVDEILEAKKNGHKPPWELYTWCVYETAKNQPNCMHARPDLPPEEQCGCDKIVKGKWEDGSHRRFSDCCKGKLSRSRGFVDLDNIHKRFQSSDQEEWEAQQECSKPETGGMVFKTWDDDRYGVKWWSPDPALGPIIMGVDFGGGTTPAAVNWYQILAEDTYAHPKNATRGDEPTKLLKAGTRVCFDEIYRAETGNIEIAELINEKEAGYKKQYPDWKVLHRFGDPANAAAIRDFRRLGLIVKFYCTRDILEQIKTCNAVLRDDAFAVDLVSCIMFPQEAAAYHYPGKKPGFEYEQEKPVDDFNHTMSNFRYVMENLKLIEKRGSITGAMPRTGGRIHQTAKSPVKSGTARYMPR
jgi:hypothetical protein